MTDINFEDIITLEDGKEYVVTSKVKYQGKDYIYIVDIKDPKNLKFAEIEKENGKVYVSEIAGGEKKLLDKLMPLFFKDTKEIFEEE